MATKVKIIRFQIIQIFRDNFWINEYIILTAIAIKTPDLRGTYYEWTQPIRLGLNEFL